MLVGIISFARRSYLTVRGVVEHFSAPYSLLDEKKWKKQKRRTYGTYQVDGKNEQMVSG